MHTNIFPNAENRRAWAAMPSTLYWRIRKVKKVVLVFNLAPPQEEVWKRGGIAPRIVSIGNRGR
jgi:hypothetical protein